MWGHLGN